MTDEKRCEPPGHLRDKDQLVCWLRRSDDEQMLASWRTGPVPFWNIFDSDSEYLPDGWLAFEGWRYVAPVTPPATIAALVEALENLMDVQTFATGWDNGVTDATGTMNEGDHWHGLAMDRATAALALYRGETGQ